MKRRGEVFTMTMVILVSIAAFLVGSSSPLKGLLGFGGQKTKQTRIIKSESKPVFVQGTDGKQYVLQTISKESSTLTTNEEPKMTLWQKLMVLPKVWVILMILGIFFPPVAGIMGILNRKLWGETKKIVGGVEESLKKLDDKPEVKKDILDTLSKKYDSSTKLMVSKIKSKL